MRVEDQNSSEWLADYDRPPEAIKRLPLQTALPLQNTSPAPKAPAPEADQSNAQWISERDRAERDQQNACLDPVNILNTKYLPETCLQQGDSKIVKSPHGTGKSTAVRQAIRSVFKAESDRAASVLIVCAGVAQAESEHQKNSGFELYSKQAQGEIVADRVIVCIDSIQRINRRYDLIIVDESEQIAAAPLKKNLHAAKKHPQGRIHLYHHLAVLLHKASRVVLLDSDAGELTETLCAYAGLAPQLIENKYKSLGGAKVELIKSRGEFLQRFEDSENAHLFCAAAEDARALNKLRKQPTTLITRDTSKRKKRAFIDAVSTREYFSGDLITTTSLRSGISIDEGFHDIKTVFGLVKVGEGYPPLTEQIQGMRRARGVEHFVVYIDTAALKVSLSTDPVQLRAALEEAKELDAKHISQYLTSTPETGVQLDKMTTDMQCIQQAELNRQRNNPVGWIKAAFEELGATVTTDRTDRPLLDKIHAKKQKQGKELARAEAIQHATTAPIPATVDHCDNETDKALFTAKHRFKYTDELTREVVRRDIEAGGRFISSIKRRQHECRPQAELAKEDSERLNDSTCYSVARVAAMTQDAIGLCWHLLDGFTSENTEAILKPWLIRNASKYYKASGGRCVDPSGIRSAAFLKRLLEGYGITVTSRKSNGKTIHEIDRSDHLNAIALDQLSQQTVPIVIKLYNNGSETLVA